MFFFFLKVMNRILHAEVLWTYVDNKNHPLTVVTTARQGKTPKVQDIYINMKLCHHMQFDLWLQNHTNSILLHASPPSFFAIVHAFQNPYNLVVIICKEGEQFTHGNEKIDCNSLQKK